MAQRQMISLAGVDTDAFLDLPAGCQALYFHLNARADDDGFVGSPRKIARAIGCGEDDLRRLTEKGVLIAFDSGVVAIRDWLLSNKVKSDRYHPTVYQAERAALSTDEAQRYQPVSATEPERSQSGPKPEPQPGTGPEPGRSQGGPKPEAQVSPGKVSPGKASPGEVSREERRASRFTPPAEDEVRAYAAEAGLLLDAAAFVDFYESCGWKVGNKPMRSWQAAVRNWARNEGRFADGIASGSRAGPRGSGNRVSGQRDLYEVL